MAAFMIGKSLKARRQNEAIGKLFDEAGMALFLSSSLFNFPRKIFQIFTHLSIKSLQIVIEKEF